MAKARTDAPLPAEAGAARGAGLVKSGARILPLDAGFYAFTLVPPDRGSGAGANSSPSAIHICAAPGSATLERSNLSGRDDPWLADWQQLFVTAPPGGSAALLTGYCSQAAETGPLEIEVRRLDRNGPSAAAPPQSAGSPPPLDLGVLVLGLIPDAEEAAGYARLEAVAVLRDAGTVRFLDTGWIGRLGRGLSVESFTLIPRGASSAPIEYKALTAAGEETAWTTGAAACGEAGAGASLIGFSVRQRPGSGPPVFDCEYSGYFQSGAIAGPARNGAPCLSPVPNDPLEGLRIRLVPRPPQAGV